MAWPQAATPAGIPGWGNAGAWAAGGCCKRCCAGGSNHSACTFVNSTCTEQRQQRRFRERPQQSLVCPRECAVRSVPSRRPLCQSLPPLTVTLPGTSRTSDTNSTLVVGSPCAHAGRGGPTHVGRSCGGPAVAAAHAPAALQARLPAAPPPHPTQHAASTSLPTVAQKRMTCSWYASPPPGTAARQPSATVCSASSEHGTHGSSVFS